MPFWTQYHGGLMVYFITEQSSFVVLVSRSLVMALFMAGTLEILCWQMSSQLVSGPMGLQKVE